MDNIAQVGLMVRTDTGLEPLPSDPEQAKHVLARVKQGPSEPFRARAGASNLFQRTQAHGFLRLAGAEEPFVAYAPTLSAVRQGEISEQHLQLAPHDVHFSLFRPTGQLVNRWLVPPGTFVIGIVQSNVPPFLDGGHGFPADGQPIDILFDYTLRDHPTDRDLQYLDVVATLRGNEIGRVVGLPRSRDGGPFPLVPTLKAYGPGNYKYEAYQDGELFYEESYIQRALVFTEPGQVAPDTNQQVQLRNSFRWADDTAGHPVPLVSPTWKVIGIGNDEVNGVGGQIAYNWDPAMQDLAVARQVSANPAASPGRYGVRVEATAQTLLDPGITNGTVDTVTESILDSVPGKCHLVISNDQVVPADFDPTEVSNSTTTFSADLVAMGYTSNVLLDWQLEVVDSNNVTVRTFRPKLSEAAGLHGPFSHVQRQWDGRDGAGTIVEPGEYTFRLVGRAGEPSAANPTPSPTPPLNFKTVEAIRFSADEPDQSPEIPPALYVAATESGGVSEVAAHPTSQPLLELRDGNNVVASSVDYSDDNATRWKKILRYSGASKTLQLRAANVPFQRGAQLPTKLKVQLRSTVSNVTRTVELAQKDGKNLYGLTDFTFNNQFIVPGSMTGGNAATFYTGSRVFPGSTDTEDFLRSLGTFGGQSIPGPRRLLGQFYAAPSLRDPLQAEANPENWRCLGFEPVEVTITDSTPSNVLDPRNQLRIRLKVRHQAEAFYSSSHGTHRTGHLDLVGTLTPGVNFTNDDVGGLRTLILSACHVLDLNDYNNEFGLPGRDHEHERSEATRRYSPGMKWFNATNGNAGKPEVVLLGFNARAAERGMDSATIEEFFRALGRLESNSSTDRAHAWMVANFDMGRNGVEDGYHACAWDRSYYYYYIPVQRGANGRVRPETRKGVYQIPRPFWGGAQMTPQDWYEQLPAAARATQVKIRK